MNYEWIKSIFDYSQLVLSILIIIVLFSKNKLKNYRVNLFIMLLAFIIVLNFFGLVYYTEWIKNSFPKRILLKIDIALPSLSLAIGSLFYLISKEIKYPQKKFKGSDLKFFFFTFIYLILVISMEPKTILNQAGWFILIIRLHTIIFIFLSLKNLNKKLDVNRFFKIFLTLYLIMTFIKVYEYYSWVIFKLIEKTTAWYIYLFLEVIMTAILSYFFIKIIKRPKLLHTKEKKDETFINEMKKIIDKAMNENKLYRLSEINLTYLAQEINVPKNHITQYLNNSLNKNFNQYITEFRIDESKDLLKKFSSKEKSVENILYEVGYNSKSVFYTAFKAQVGLTPKQYRKQQQGENNI